MMKLLLGSAVTPLAVLAVACGGDSTPGAGSAAGVGDARAQSITATVTTTSVAASAAATRTASATAPAAAAATSLGPQPLTPAQTEGPYYPPDKPADRDNDLTVVKGANGMAAGDVLLLSGVLLHKDGTPVSGATVEIWHVDKNGIYLHPNQPEARRDKNFQSYRESVTDASGAWSFRTIDPPAYEGRPRHIHVKVKVDGKEVLTTQIYFDGDPLLARDGVSQGVDRSLLTVKVETVTKDGKQVKQATHRLVIA